ncbi:MAG: hypothetical protein BGP05_01205 [Rhizobiales bacterium 62-47]|nr:MAG: hypothetical protein BGP05_01205 [Rhizobiales bacterium 62-47]
MRSEKSTSSIAPTFHIRSCFQLVGYAPKPCRNRGCAAGRKRGLNPDADHGGGYTVLAKMPSKSLRHIGKPHGKLPRELLLAFVVGIDHRFSFQDRL